MNRTLRTALLSYGAFAAVNFALAYFTSGARTGRTVGQNKLYDFNDSLLPLNVLALFAPAGSLGATGLVGPGSAAAAPSGSTVTTSPGGSLFPSQSETVTQTPSGTTTLFSP